MTIQKKILVIAPHPDDETLGCGGTILKHKSQSDEVNWMIVTKAYSEDGWSEKLISDRENEIKMVYDMYGFNNLYRLNYPTTRLDTIPFSEMIKSLNKNIHDFKPQIVYLPNFSDIHSDHQIVFKAAWSVLKSFRSPFIERILMYEAISETEYMAPLSGNAFQPNFFSDITDFFDSKMEIMRIYKSELMLENLPRTIEVIEAQARYRGSRIGVRYAEAFSILFERI